METDIPYMLYLSFKKMTYVKTLFDFMGFFNLINIGEEPIDAEEKIVKFHFKNDVERRVVFYVMVDIDSNMCENINIAISIDTPLNIIKELFSFLERLGSDNFTLIDQEIKNQLFFRDHEKFLTPQQTTVIPTSWTDETERLATISVNFDDFYKNSVNLTRRDILLRK